MFTFCCKYMCFPEHTAVPKKTETYAGEMTQPRLQSLDSVLQYLSQSGLCISCWATLLLVFWIFKLSRGLMLLNRKLFVRGITSSSSRTVEFFRYMPNNNLFLHFFSQVIHGFSSVFIPYSFLKREQKVYFSMRCFSFFLGYLRHICYIHLDQWISEPSRTLASCPIFLDWFWPTFVASLVSNFGDFVSSWFLLQELLLTSVISKLIKKTQCPSHCVKPAH